jgi:hypothetical protein
MEDGGMARDFLSHHVIESSSVPIDTTGAARTGDYYSLKDFQGVVFVIVQGAWAGGTPAVTLKQAQAVAGTNAKALGMAEYYSKVALTGTVNVLSAIVSDTFNLAATANRITMVEVSAADLDRAGGFDCVGIDVASPSTNADLIAVIAILYGLRYSGDPALLPDPKVD